MSLIYFNLFMRNWMNCVASIEQIDQAVIKGYITEEEATTIKNTERSCSV